MVDKVPLNIGMIQVSLWGKQLYWLERKQREDMRLFY